jgi:hypothetical protein
MTFPYPNFNCHKDIKKPKVNTCEMGIVSTYGTTKYKLKYEMF